MKYIRTALFAVTAALLFPGCDMTEDNRNCPDKENVTLRFSLLDKNSAEVFRDYIDATELMLFEGTGASHSSRTIATASLGDDRQIKLWLDPGIYTVVAWSNAATKTTMTAAGTVSYPTAGEVVFNTTESGDPLYTAADRSLGITRGFNPTETLITFTVPDDGSHVDQTICFTHAHNCLDVYLKGYSVNGRLPVIEVEGARKGFTFCMNYLAGGTVSYSKQSVARNTAAYGTVANAPINIPRVRRNDNDVYIHVINPETGERDWTVSLNDVLDSFTDFVLDDEVVIPILFEYFEGRFVVKMPDWETEGSTPGLD